LKNDELLECSQILPGNKLDCELFLASESEGENYVPWRSEQFGCDNEGYKVDDHDDGDDDDEDNDNEELHSPPKSPGISRPSNRCRGSSCRGRGPRSNNVTESADVDLQKFGRDGTIRQLADIGNKAPGKVILWTMYAGFY
jgi:hypothetical protein